MNKEKRELPVERVLNGLGLIFVGFVLLLNTTKTVPWRVWGIFFIVLIKLWPAWLIFFGFQIIFSSSIFARSVLKIISTVLTTTLFILIILASVNKIVLPEVFTKWDVQIYAPSWLN